MIGFSVQSEYSAVGNIYRTRSGRGAAKGNRGVAAGAQRIAKFRQGIPNPHAATLVHRNSELSFVS